MGTEPPADAPGSPVSQVSQRQARTEQALNDIGTAAAHQQSQPPVAFDSVAEAQVIRMEACALLSTAMMSMSNQSQTLQPGQTDFTIAAATIAPIALQLANANSIIRDVQATRGKAESFNALIAIALANQSQQIHGLAQFQAASVRSGASATAGNLSQRAPHAQPDQPLLSPERRQLARQTRQHKVAHKQTLQVQERLDNLPVASRPIRPLTSTASAVMTGHINDGVQTVYPGKRGELQWDRWEGRSVPFFLPLVRIFVARILTVVHVNPLLQVLALNLSSVLCQMLSSMRSPAIPPPPPPSCSQIAVPHSFH